MKPAWLGIVAALPCANALADANLVTNPNFDTGIDGWQPVTSGMNAQVTWNASFGSPAGSLHTSAPQPNTSAQATQCITVGAPLRVDFILDGYVEGSSVSGGQANSATAFQGPDCSGANLGDLPDSEETFPPDGWHGFHNSLFDAALPAGTQSVLLTIGSEAGALPGSFDDYDYDNIWFGPERIFADGFES